MENIPNEADDNNKRSAKSVFFKSIYFGFVFAAITVLIVVILYLMPKDISKTEQEIQTPTSNLTSETPEKDWQKPVSQLSGIPLNLNQKLYLYSLDNHQSRLISDETKAGSGESGKGDSSALPSPDLLYTAFIDRDEKLILMSNDTAEQKVIAQKAKYISGWSTGSQKLVYFMEPDTIVSRTENEMGGGQDNSTEKFEPGVDGGYFMFNIDTGKTTKLSPLTYFDSFIDNDRILTMLPNDNYQFIVFNTNTFVADYKFIKDTFQFGSGQFEFTKDGSKWTFTDSYHPTSDANIILADFPNRKGIIIDSGSWAYVQGSIITENGDKVAYQKYAAMNEGVPDNRTWLYDVKSKTKKEIAKGSPRLWIGDNRLLVSDNHNEDIKYSIVDVLSGKIENIKLNN